MKLKGNDKLTIVLTPEHLSMASVRAGKVLQAERVDLNPAEWDGAWKSGLRNYDQPLRQLLARFGGVNKSHCASIFYISPGAVCRAEISEFDEATSVAKMENAILQSVGRGNPADAIALHTGESSSLTLGVADDESNLQQIYAWLNRSKIHADRMIPSDAGVVHKAMLAAAKCKDGSAVLYLSDRSSVICYYENGNPKLVRLIELGYGKLADVYKVANQLLNEHSQANKPDRNAFSGTSSDQDSKSNISFGTQMLFTHGIPLGKDKPSHRLENIMPSMAPILQRVSIEIKQTFRFASALQSPPSTLVICGPGAAIPNIEKAVAQSLDLHLEIDPSATGYRPDELFGIGTSEQAVACDYNLSLELLPKAAKEVRVRSGLSRAVKVGALAVAAFIGGQYILAQQNITTAQHEIAQQSDVIERIGREEDRRESVHVLAASIGSAASLFEDTMGARADWMGVLHSIQIEDRDQIRISELLGRMNGQSPMVSISGIAIADSDGKEASQILSQYIKELREIPQVTRIQIGSTSRSQIDETTWGLNFVLGLEIASQQGEFSELMRLSDAGQEVAP